MIRPEQYTRGSEMDSEATHQYIHLQQQQPPLGIYPPTYMESQQVQMTQSKSRQSTGFNPEAKMLESSESQRPFMLEQQPKSQAQTNGVSPYSQMLIKEKQDFNQKLNQLRQKLNGGGGMSTDMDGSQGSTFLKNDPQLGSSTFSPGQKLEQSINNRLQEFENE
jgi:hypothetical protein|tara:strand:- start:54 stop:545 length:492 start_codon:yes stop_codon:yes gene_type:complete